MKNTTSVPEDEIELASTTSGTVSIGVTVKVTEETVSVVSSQSAYSSAYRLRSTGVFVNFPSFNLQPSILVLRFQYGTPKALLPGKWVARLWYGFLLIP